MNTYLKLSSVFLILGLSQLALANHHDGESGNCKKMMQEKKSMQEMDTNKDGVVSHDEFTTANLARIEKTFTHIDANGDGKLDNEEQQIAQAIWETRYKKYHTEKTDDDPHHGMNMPDDEYHQMPNDVHHTM
jgi:Ca2+-binding EF-hand superfamily protein